MLVTKVFTNLQVLSIFQSELTKLQSIRLEIFWQTVTVEKSLQQMTLALFLFLQIDFKNLTEW